MSGLKCPEEVWVVNGKPKEFPCYYEGAGRRSKEVEVVGAEVVGAIGKVRAMGSKVKFLGKGTGLLLLRPFSDVNEILIGDVKIKVKKLDVKVKVERAFLLAPTKLALEFRGDPGEVEYSGYFYGSPVKGKVEVPSEKVEVIFPRHPVGGFLELHTVPLYLLEFELPEPEEPVKGLRVLEEPVLGSRVLVNVELAPETDFEVELYGDVVKERSDSEGSGLVAVAVRERSEEAKVRVGLYERRFDVPLPREPFSIKLIELNRGGELRVVVDSSVNEYVEVSVSGLDEPFEREAKLVRGENVVSLRLPKLRGFSETRRLRVSFKYGFYEVRREVIGEVPGSARLVMYDGSHMWIFSENDFQYGFLRIRKGVNVLKPPISGIRIERRYPVRGPFDAEEVVAVSVGKCVQVFGESVGTYCLDDEIKFVSVNGAWTLFSDGKKSAVSPSPKSLAKVLGIGGHLGVCSKGEPVICNEEGCFRVSSKGEVVKIADGADKLEGPFLLYNKKLYLIEGNSLREVGEADDFSYFDGNLAILKGGTVIVNGKRLELRASAVSIGSDYLFALEGNRLRVYDLEGNLLYAHPEEVESAKALKNGIVLKRGNEMLLGEFVEELPEEPLIQGELLETWTEEDKLFVVSNYELFEEVIGCEALAEYMTPEEGFTACVIARRDERYSPYVSDLNAFETASKLLELSHVMRRGAKLREVFLKVLNLSLPLEEIELRKAVSELERELRGGELRPETVERVRSSLELFREPPGEAMEVFREASSLRSDLELGELLVSRRLSLEELVRLLSSEARYPRRLVAEAKRLLEISEALGSQ